MDAEVQLPELYAADPLRCHSFSFDSAAVAAVAVAAAELQQTA